jgi:hypothetical protein
VDDYAATRRYVLTSEEREAILEEEQLLAHLLERIIAARGLAIAGSDRLSAPSGSPQRRR